MSHAMEQRSKVIKEILKIMFSIMGIILADVRLLEQYIYVAEMTAEHVERCSGHILCWSKFPSQTPKASESCNLWYPTPRCQQLGVMIFYFEFWLILNSFNSLLKVILKNLGFDKLLKTMKFQLKLTLFTPISITLNILNTVILKCDLVLENIRKRLKLLKLD